MANDKLTSYMGEALALAREAGKSGEVPVGAVVIRDRTVIGRGFNLTRSRNDPSAHAEIIAIRDAASQHIHVRSVRESLNRSFRQD